MPPVEYLKSEKELSMSTTSIVVIDDDIAIGKLITIALNRVGYEVYCATHAREGIDLIREVQPALALIDLRLPDMSGWDCIEIIQNDDKLRYIQLIAITASGQYNREKLISSEINQILIKPFTPSQLQQIIAVALKEG